MTPDAHAPDPRPRREPARQRPLSRWTRAAFGASFDLVYPARGAQAGAAEIRALLEWPEIACVGHRAVDLSCGAGRHVAPLAHRGWTVLGLDLSAARLGRGAPGPAGASRLVRADRRRTPLASGSVDLALLLFQSLGYGAEEEDAATLVEAARVVRPGGLLLLELLDAAAVRAGPGDAEAVRRGGALVRARRRLSRDGSHVAKRVRIEHPDGRLEVWTERVRLEPPDAHRRRLRGAGWEPLAAYGGADRRPHVPGATPLWLLARARPSPGT